MINQLIVEAWQGWDSLFFVVFPLLVSILYFRFRNRQYRQTSKTVIVSMAVLIGLVGLYFLIAYSVIIIYVKLHKELNAETILYIGNMVKMFFFVPFLIFAIDRQILVYNQLKVKNLLKDDQVIAGGKDEINSIIKAHTLAAKKSVFLFSGRMTWIERDADYLKNLKVFKKNLCSKPLNKQDEYRLELIADCDVETKFYTIKDPSIRGRIIDGDIPGRAKVILISKEINPDGTKIYKVQIFTSKNGEVIIDALSNLFDVLWINGN